MMKRTFSILVFFILMVGCASNSTEENNDIRDTAVEAGEEVVLDPSMISVRDSIQVAEHAKTFSNKAFRNVTVSRLNDQNFRIVGQARVFEAAFSWVIEDGLNELSEGHQTTDAGAPEWGNFSFDVRAIKESENSTLHLILFESSAKDGSRTNELPIFLY